MSQRPGRAKDLYNKLMGSWGHRPDRERITVKLGEQEFQVLEGLNLPDGIVCQDVLPSGWVTLYRHPKHPELEVKVRTRTKPPKRRTLKVGGKKRQLVAVSSRRVGKNNKEANVATRTKKKKEEELDDELEGLEDLEDLDDEDLEDEEEPDDEDDEDEEDEEPAPKKRGRTSSKKTPAKAKAKTTRKRKAAEPEDEEDDEDEDEDEEDEAPARSKKSSAKKGSSKTATKSSTKAKSSTKSSKAKNGNLPATRELPKGQLGPADLAEMVGGDCDARYVRIFLRENYERPEGGRWAFSKSEGRTIAKEIKAQRKKNA